LENIFKSPETKEIIKVVSKPVVIPASENANNGKILYMSCL